MYFCGYSLCLLSTGNSVDIFTEMFMFIYSGVTHMVKEDTEFHQNHALSLLEFFSPLIVICCLTFNYSPTLVIRPYGHTKRISVWHSRLPLFSDSNVLYYRL